MKLATQLLVAAAVALLPAQVTGQPDASAAPVPPLTQPANALSPAELLAPVPFTYLVSVPEHAASAEPFRPGADVVADALDLGELTAAGASHTLPGAPHAALPAGSYFTGLHAPLRDAGIPQRQSGPSDWQLLLCSVLVVGYIARRKSRLLSA